MSKFKVAVVGVTGVVGQEMLRVLAQRKFPVRELVPVASQRSAGQAISFAGTTHKVRAISPEVFEGCQLALFSAGASVSKEWCPIAASKGALVVDNSSAWRMDPDVPLCVPEVNIEAARHPKKGIIANPNCSTIQMVVALKPIHDVAKIKRVVVATYQAVSGAGAKAVASLEHQMHAMVGKHTIPAGTIGAALAGNLLMTWKPDASTGYSEEELKMVKETQKILDPSIRVSPTAVRVPVVTAHSEAVTIETERPITAQQVRELLERAPGVEVVDDFAHGVYPQPLAAAGTDPVYVGRIRDDIGQPGGIQMWIVSDNLRKGAALNAVQIAEQLL